MKNILKDSRGIALAVIIYMMTILLLLSGASLLFSQLDLRVTSNERAGTRTFYTAEAGISHGIQTLSVVNGSTDFQTVSNANPGTKIPLLDNVSFGGASYSVIGEPVAGSNPKRALLTATGCLPGGNPCPSGNAKAIVQAEVGQFSASIPPLPGTVTLVGPNANFTGGMSNAKLLSGDAVPGCGSTPSVPVVAVTDAASKTAVQTAINNSKPDTYVTSYSGGQADDVKASGEINYIKTNYGFDYTNVNDLEGLVSKIQRYANSVVAGGATGVDLGSVGNEKIVVVNGNYTLSASNGAGILVVKGDLTFNGNVSYTGLIMVVGTGVMKRNGGGNGTIKGGVIVAKVVGSDGIYGTADDAIGSGPTLDTSGGGASNVLFCPSAINNATSKVIQMLAWKQNF